MAPIAWYISSSSCVTGDPMPIRTKIRRRRRTKIVATLGPASSSPEVIARLFHAGADIFRLNFSHGTHDDHAARIAMIRDLEVRFDRASAR